MKKMLAMMLMMSLMTVSCNKSGGGSSSEESPEAATTTPITENNSSEDNTTVTSSPSAPAPTSTVPAQALSFGFNVEMFNFTGAQEDKYNQAIAIVKKVVATDAFRTKILNHTYNGKKIFVDNRGRTNKQIYQSILDAAETLQPAKNNIMDVGVKMYYENNSVVGWTNGSITYINVNRKYFDQYDPNEVAGNLFHEWMHKLGYGHSSSATPSRPYSVPYAVGYLIRDIGKKFL